MTEENAEFYEQCNSIELKNSIEMKMGKKSKKLRHLKEQNFEN